MRLPSILSLIASGHAIPQYFVNNNESPSVTLPCGPNSAADIAAKGLDFVQWFKREVDPRTGPIGDEKKILEARADLDHALTLESDYFTASRTDGSLTLTPEDGRVGVNDQAIFRCRLAFKDQNVIDDQLVLVSTILPSDSEIKPNIIDDSAAAKLDYVFEENYPGALATCEAGHAKPDAKVKWVVMGKDGNQISEVHGGTNILESNPAIRDHDDEDTANSIELLLTLWNDQTKKGLLREYDQTYYMCQVTYEKAVDGKLTPVEYTARYPEDENKYVRVQHDVQNVRVLLNQQEVSGEYIDFSYYMEDNEPLISCDSDGFDPNSKNVITGPNKKDISSAVQAIRNKESTTLHVECSAQNNLNSAPVSVSKDLQVKYIGDLHFTFTPGLIGSMPVEIAFEPETSGEDVEIFLYPYKKNPLDNNQFGSKAEAEKAAAALAQSGITPIKVPCKNGKCVYKGKDLGDFFVVASVPGTDIVKIVHESKESHARAHTEFQVQENLPIKGAFDKHPGLEDSDKILFWRNKGSEDECVWEQVIDGLKDISTADKVGREIEAPIGGQYIVCYDLDGVANHIHNGGHFKEQMDKVWEHNEPYCEFYSTEPLGTGSLWWLWVIIIIILLIVIAAIVWWIKQKQNNAEAGDDEDPKLVADQEHAATNANDEFDQVQDGAEKQPMLDGGDSRSE